MSTDRPADLMATMQFDPMTGIVGLDRKIDEFTAQAAAAGRGFDRHGTRNELHAATFRLVVPSTIRLAVSAAGVVAIEARPAS